MGQAQLVANAVGRKGRMVARRMPRLINRVRARTDDYARQPPVILTTVPKSGTHLAYQLIQAVPGLTDYGTFIATIPSWGRRPRSATAEARRVRRLVPGEIARAHLHHRPEAVDAARERHAFVVFLYRDPRDVIVSEGHYLADMAPWHSLHREFAARSPSERIDLAIEGLPGNPELYPDAGRRFSLWAGWLDDADVVVRFEDLIGIRRDEVLHDLASRYERFAGARFNLEFVTRRAVEAIDPSGSHTFREGRAGVWRQVFTADQVRRVEELAGPVLERYGYA